MKKKFEQIIESIEQLITSNQLQQGERLPSIRVMAEKFMCNKSTIIRAYQELENNHRIYSIPKGGFYLVENHSPSRNIQEKIDFSEVMPEPKLLPYKEFNHCINRSVELYKDHLFTYGATQGLESLRKVLVNHFSEQQIFTSEEHICIASGAQQALNIVTKMPFPNQKKSILVEQPTYGLMQEMVIESGLNLIGIDRRDDGINLDELETIFREEEIKFFYIIPRFHNPLGTSYSEKTKKGIVALAEKYDVYLIEDDYLADIDTNSKALPAHYYDVSQRTIYIKSFSKAFMPGIRIAAVVLPEQLVATFIKHKKYDDLNTSILAQGALEIFIKSGMYRNHVRKVQLAYRKKMDCLRDCVTRFPHLGIEIAVPKTGFFAWMKLSHDLNVEQLIRQLKDREIYVSPANNYFINGAGEQNAIRLCIAKLTNEQIRMGMCAIFEEASKLMSK